MITIRSTVSHPDVETGLKKMVGEVCWAIIAGPGNGSAILLDLGEKTLHDHDLSNTALSGEERRFEAAYSIHVWCSWRVEKGGQVVGSAAAIPEEGWWERSGLARIKGRYLTDFDLGTPIPDFRLHFDDVTLSLFVDTLSESDSDSAFSVRTPDGRFVVFANGVLQHTRAEL
jgi:hypothetical protein